MKIDLSYTKEDKKIKLKDKELYNETAKYWAEKIVNGTKKTQARNFYEKILRLQDEIKKSDFESVYPFIKMLNSKVAYGVSRKVVSREFQEMMESCIAQIKNDSTGKQTFENFKLFFEAVLGFFKGRN